MRTTRTYPSLLKSVATTHVEPYRYLFAIGAANALSGAGVWILYAFGLMTYPSQIHPLMMSGGFLLTIAFGFLWTALPRFTQSPLATFSELSPLLLSSIAGTLAAAFNSERWCLFFLMCSCLISLRFAGRRFVQRKQDAPPSFVFVGVALLLGTLSVLVLFINQFVHVPTTLYVGARSFFLKGIMLFLTIGVGFRLIPAILGVNAPQRMEPVNATTRLKKMQQKGISENLLNLALMVDLLVAFTLEALGFVQISAILFSCGLVWSAVRGFHIHRIPSLNNRFAFVVWCSVVFMALGPLLIVVFPSIAVHLWHLTFIGGLGLVTTMVSTRVSVSHSGFSSVHTEERKPFIAWMGGLILLAALTRASVAWFPEMALSHYTYAACAWIVAMCLWLYHFVRTTFKAERIRIVALQQELMVVKT